MDIDPQAGLAVTVRFSSPAHLDLTVTGFTGSGYEGRMRANLQNPSEPMQYSYGSQQKGAISIEGSARLGPVEPGEYELQLTLLDGSSPYGNSMIVHAMPVTLGTGANSITMPLPSLYTLRVDLPEGQIAGQVQIQPVTDRTLSMRRRRPAEDGGTTFDGLPAGRYTIRVDGNPELMGQMEVEVPAALTVLFTPQKINALRVTITDPNGYLASLGFESGDLVVALNGSRFEGQEQLAVLGLALQTADKLTLTVLRDEEEFDIELETKRLMGGDPGGMIRPATR
ncbi:MAG: hypothetical protein ACE5GW_09055 [Planctomycetota bacterium]